MIKIGEKCPVCKKDTFYQQTDRITKRVFNRCAHCLNEVTTHDPIKERLLREKEERMEDLKRKGGTVPIEGDIRFPETPKWKLRDQKRAEEMKGLIIKVEPVVVAPTIELDRHGKPIKKQK